MGAHVIENTKLAQLPPACSSTSSRRAGRGPSRPSAACRGAPRPAAALRGLPRRSAAYCVLPYGRYTFLSLGVQRAECVTHTPRAPSCASRCERHRVTCVRLGRVCTARTYLSSAVLWAAG
eukprot:5383790-Prymnesium_polylepis.1